MRYVLVPETENVAMENAAKAHVGSSHPEDAYAAMLAASGAPALTEDEAVERMARAIHASSGLMHMDEGREFQPVSWEELDDPAYPVVREGYLTAARAAFRALKGE